MGAAPIDMMWRGLSRRFVRHNPAAERTIVRAPRATQHNCRTSGRQVRLSSDSTDATNAECECGMSPGVYRQ